MCCAPTERRVSWLEARKTSDGTSPADPTVQSLSERAAHSCPMSRSDPCRIFLSDRLLGDRVNVLRPRLAVRAESAKSLRNSSKNVEKSKSECQTEWQVPDPHA